MPRGLRDIRRKMKAVKSTRQVTKAMELVAASKMRRAVTNAQMLREYAVSAWKILQRIAETHPNLHPFLEERKPQNVLIVLMTSDRGLCGSLNAHVCRATERYLVSSKQREEASKPKKQNWWTRQENTGTAKVDFVAVGRKGQQYLSRMGHNVVAAFPAFSNHPKFRDIFPLSKFVCDAFRKNEYDHVVLIYPGFVSALVQEIDIKVLLPFSEGELKRMAESLVERKRKNAMDEDEDEIMEFIFEPSPQAVLDTIIPQLTEMQFYQAVLEAAASEHSARMVAMRNASENASEILDDLTLVYNQTRQANITAELAELSGAAAALS